MPPVPLPRRMFGGARTKYIKPLRVGEDVKRVSKIADVQIKTGRTGTLVICTVDNDFFGEDGLAMTEQWDIVYRDNPPPNAPAGNSGKTNPAPSDHEWIETVAPNPVILFRYSAIPFHGHLIHSARTYVTQVLGYPGLTAHGPPTATI